MPEFPKCLLVVTAEIDREVEAEWNKWYDDVHLPEALACPGVIRGTRYLAARDASLTDHGAHSTDAARVYAAVYEPEGPEAMQTPEFQAMRGRYEPDRFIRENPDFSRVMELLRKGHFNQFEPGLFDEQTGNKVGAGVVNIRQPAVFNDLNGFSGNRIRLPRLIHF